MKNIAKKLLGPVQILVLAIMISAVGTYYVHAFSGGSYSEPPCSNPSQCNADAPINTSSTGQSKDGTLMIVGHTSSGAVAANGLIISNGRLGVGTNSPASSLKAQFNGKVGADAYCDQAGNNCMFPGTWGGSTSSPPTGGLSGSGTANKVSKWTAGTTLGDSQITDNGTNVGIGTSPSEKLDVEGFIRAKAGRVYAGTGGNYLFGDATSLGVRVSPSGGGFYVQTTGSGNPGANVIAGAFYYSSDKNLKTNINPLQDSLSKVLQLQGVSFNWKASGKPSVGLIAQDVEKLYPELVSVDANGAKTLEYGALLAPLIESIKAQQKQIDELKAQVKELQYKK